MFTSRKIRRGGTRLLDFSVEGESIFVNIAGTHTHTVGVGAPDSDRIVILAISVLSSLYGGNINSVTIGGGAATILGSGKVVLAYKRLTTGTAATVVLSSSAGSYHLTTVKAYRLIKPELSHLDFGGVTGFPNQVIHNIECSPGGVVIATSGVAGPGTIPAAPTVTTWNGTDPITLDYAPNYSHRSSHISTLEKSTIRDVTIAQSANQELVAVAASW